MAILGLTLERLDHDGRRKTWTRATDATIAGQCGLCDRSVRRALCDLERGSWIERIYTDSRDERRELRLGPAVIEMWQGRAAEAEIRAGQQLLPFDRPTLPGPSKAAALPVREPQTSGVHPLRSAVGAEGLHDVAVRAVRTELSGLSGQNCPAAPYITENVLRNHHPPARTTCSVPPEEEDGLVDDRERKTTGTAGEAHIARGYGPARHDPVKSGSDAGPSRERATSSEESALPWPLPSERLARAVRSESEAWNVWSGAWDGSPPLPMDAERRQDLHTLCNDHCREGPDVLAAAIRAGRELHRSGRLRLFDLRRYCCSGIRSTCIQRGRAAVAAARERRKVDWQSRVDDEVSRRMRDGRDRGESRWRGDIECEVHREIRAGTWPPAIGERR